MKVAFFDAQGVCRVVASGWQTGFDYPHYAEVDDTVGPNDVYFDVAVGVAKPKVDVPVTLPENPMAPFAITLPDGVVASINGVEQTGTVTLDPLVDTIIELSGKAKGHMVFKNYATRRAEAYPRLGDQLDALWEIFNPPAGSKAAAIKAQIMQIKADIPKPPGA